MYLKIPQKYISIDTSKISLFTQIDAINRVELHYNKDNNLGELIVVEGLGAGKCSEHIYTDKDYNYLTAMYNKIFSQLGINKYMDLSCGNSRFLILKKLIIGISHEIVTANTQKIIIYLDMYTIPNSNKHFSSKFPSKKYSTNDARSYTALILEVSDKDIKADYKDLLAQLAYAPMKKHNIPSLKIDPIDKDISVDMEDFSFFLPQSTIDVISIQKLYDFYYLYIALEPTPSPWWERVIEHISHPTKDYNSINNLYTQIISRIDDNDFIDLSCGEARIFMRKAQIYSVCHHEPYPNSEIIYLNWNNQASEYSQSAKQLSVECSSDNIKNHYNELLSQINNAPKNNIKLKENKASFWNDWHMIENNSPPLLKVVYKSIGIISQ